jgi:aconitate decarboxylase
VSAPDANASSEETIAFRLGHWLSDLRYEDIPEEVVSHAKLCLIDGLGCGIYGAVQPWGRIAGDVAVSLGGRPASSLFGRSQKAAAPDAAMANGTAIHGFEIDDVHVSSSYHPGCVTIPSVLALAEARGLGGRDILRSMIAGYEIGIRLGICAGVTHSTSGFHVTGTVGPVGAAAAAAALLGLEAEKAAHAIALGATQAGGLYAARKGAMAKRFHAGRAAQSGVIGALLAEQGFTGALDVIEAPFGGFMSTLRGQSDPSTMLEGLGQSWETSRVGFKIYAACASAHTTIDAVGEMMASGLTADTLDSLTIRMSKKGFTNVGWAYQPGEIVAAQMNGYFAAAVKLIDGDAFVEQYREERMSDPRILSVIERIKIVHDPELDLGGAEKRHAVIAEARLRDGRTRSVKIEQRTGSAQRPISREQLTAKFFQLASQHLDRDRAERLIDDIWSLDRPETEQGLELP